jgi:hypothetical protein
MSPIFFFMLLRPWGWLPTPPAPPPTTDNQDKQP